MYRRPASIVRHHLASLPSTPRRVAAGIIPVMNLPDSDFMRTRRVLIAVTGLSPQVVTETLFALATRVRDPWIPDQVILITTSRGAENARLQLLSDEPGWFHRLRAEWGLPEIEFNESCIRIVHRADGSPLDDIRDDDDNLRVADEIASIVRGLAARPDLELHASIAGGRKTMGYCLGYAMSLFGRTHDRLSHVLVSAPFEHHPDFYYPSRKTRIIRSLERGHDALDASRARVWLGDIPFVRLSEGMPKDLLGGTTSFSDAVRAAQRRLSPPSLILRPAQKLVICGDAPVELPPVQMAFLMWFARRRINAAPALLKPKWDGMEEAKQFLGEYRLVVPLLRDAGSTADRLARGMDKTFFDETNSKLKRSLKEALGALVATPYLIEGAGRPKRYALTISASAVKFER